MDSVRNYEVIPELEHQGKSSSLSTEEQRQFQDDSTSKEVHLSSEASQESSSERIASDLIRQRLSEEETTCPSSNISSRRESEDRFRSDSELMTIISSVLLDENVEVEEGLSFAVVGNSRKQSAVKTDGTCKETWEEKADKLHRGISKSELARRERERLHLIRTKVNAAVVIQRWFRKWIAIKREHKERDMMLSDVKNEQEELSKEVAALTIQLAWRKHVRVEHEKNNSRTKHQKSKKAVPNSASCKPKQNGIHIYGRSIQQSPRINTVNSPNGNKRRPPYMKYQPSPAAMSYNMAMDLYHPMGSRQGNTRAAMVTASTRVRPGSMKRTVNGWSHDAGFVKKMNGKMNNCTSYRAGFN